MKIMDTKRATITRIIPVKAPIANPANPASAVPNMVIKIAATIPPNAPATDAFQKPLNAPSPTIIPTTNPAKNKPIMLPQNGKDNTNY